MKILLIRHGQSEADLLNVHEGRADYPLTKLGIQQADLMANWVENTFNPELIWSSPLIRAKKTAQILSEKVGCEVKYHSELIEWNNGVLAGMDRSEASERYPEPVDGHKPHESVRNGESAIMFRMRAEMVLSKLFAESQAYKRVAVVSHGGLISRMIHSFMKLPIINEYIIRTADTGIHLLEYKNDRRVIHFLNKTKHLN